MSAPSLAFALVVALAVAVWVRLADL